HPTRLQDTGILITEGARGEGGYLLNTLGDRFMKAYAPEQMELATRSTVSLAIGQEITEGRGVDGCVLLDLRHLGRARILERLPQIRELAIEFAGVSYRVPDPGSPRRALPDGRRADHAVGRDRNARPVRGGRVRVRERARGEPTGGKLPAGNGRVRSARRRARRRLRARGCSARAVRPGASLG